MALVKCKECGHPMSTDAAACPACGKKVKRTSTVTKIALVVIVLGVIGFVAEQYKRGEQQEQQAKTEAARVATLTPEQKAAEVSAAAAAKAKREERERRQNAAYVNAQALAAIVRKGANDPQSIEFSEASYTDDGAVLLEFRGKNKFNATILNYAVVTKDGKLAIGSKEKVAELWNKHIAGKTLYTLPRP